MADPATTPDDRIAVLEDENNVLKATIEAGHLRLLTFRDQFEITASEVEELLIENERVTAEKDKAFELLRIATEKSAQQEAKVQELMAEKDNAVELLRKATEKNVHQEAKIKELLKCKKE